MQTSFNPTICVEGRNYPSEETMPENIRAAFEEVISGALRARKSLFVGRTARFVPKLQSRIVCNSEEFNSVAQLSASQRRLYEEGLVALLPGYINERVARGEAQLQQRNKLIVACVSLIATTSYLWFHGCLTDPRFLFHFLRFLCGLTH